MPYQLDGICLAHCPGEPSHLLALAPALLPWPARQKVGVQKHLDVKYANNPVHQVLIQIRLLT